MLFICATDIIAVTLAVMPTEAAAAVAAAIVPATQQPQLSFGNPSARGGREGTQGERGTGPGEISQSVSLALWLFILPSCSCCRSRPCTSLLPRLRLVQLLLLSVLFAQWVVQLLSLGKIKTNIYLSFPFTCIYKINNLIIVL